MDFLVHMEYPAILGPKNRRALYGIKKPSARANSARWRSSPPMAHTGTPR
jgi:hypothetical protein